MTRQLTDFIRLNLRRPAGLCTLLTTLIVITPLCNHLFNCGCTWPWFGLDKYCNFHDLATPHSCPWCASKPAGALSVMISITCGYLVAMNPWIFEKKPRFKFPTAFFVLFGLGIGTFFIVANVCGRIAAWVQGYPLS